MKISISRKGVDSGSGKMASPILPCGCLCSIPIPYENSDVRYSNIHFGTRTLQDIRDRLKPESSDKRAHLDPDLSRDALFDRPKAWRPAFGQSGPAGGHLINQGMCCGGLFIFFGWFRRTKISDDGELEFDSDDPDGRHIVFGWLEVGDVVDKVPLRPEVSFLKSHPHIQFFKQEGGNNRIYVSSTTGLNADLFPTEAESIVLTRNEKPRSQWLLDEAFESLIPELGVRELTYHGNKLRWKRASGKIELHTVSRGQEFVFDGDRHPRARDYFVRHIKRVMSKKPRHCSHNFQ
ncbi:MAG: hypothetical protein LAO19_01450 [Acidobacteriia bacterium]|nr:hypothetical protein [Terriglobia bacterium]